VPARLVAQRKLSQISTDHVEFYFNIVERFAVVDSNVVANHFWEYDGIAEVSFNGSGLLSRLGILFRLFAFSVEPDVFVLDF